ncbi:MAG: efflux transporter periplasmic adaptor subunit [Legionella sp.]|nr:MAG: efflux transporter periplasmic adaptor subunit [Legionella sp.]
MRKRIELVLNLLKTIRLKSILWGLLSILLLGCVVQCIQHVGHVTAPTPPIIYKGARLIIPEQSPLRSVITLEAVQPHSVVSDLTLPSVVQALPSHILAALPPLTGQITTLPKKVGDQVQVGEILYTMTAPDLAEALSDRASTQAAYTLAQQILKRQSQLTHLDIGSMRDLQEAERANAQANADLQRALARLEALHVSEADQDTHGHLVVRSPISGVVTAVNAGLGTYWSDLTSPILTVENLSQVQIIASAQENDVSNIFLGQAVEITIDGDGRKYQATVSFITPVLDPDTRTTAIGIILDNSDQHLKPNMFAKTILKSKPRDLVLLPLTAVIQRGFDTVIFVEVAPWQFESRLVKVGPQIKNKIEIKSGLAKHEKVVLTGGIILND